MKFGLCHEGHLADGDSHFDRYHQMIREAVTAEESGFDFYGTSEQHFLRDIATTSAPEGLLATAAAKPERLRFRFMSAVISINHPVRIVERLATLDVLSNGRAELGIARSNNPYTLSAFGVHPDETRGRLNDGLPAIMQALKTGSFEYAGEIWDIPDRDVVPALVQDPHPPVLLSATSNETHEFGGKNGLGVMSGSVVLGWDYLEGNVNTYKQNVSQATPMGSYVIDSIGTFLATVSCDTTMEGARERAEDVAYAFMDINMDIYTKLSAASPGYAYLGEIQKLREHQHDLDFLMDHNPYFHIGTPDFLIERFKRLEAMGLDELILRIDGMGHEANLRSIRMIGEHVIPALR